MTPEEIVLAAFEDELEKIAGAKRYLRLRAAAQKNPGLRGAADAAYRKFHRRTKAFSKKNVSPFSVSRAPDPHAYAERVGLGWTPSGGGPHRPSDVARAAVKAGPK